MKFTVKFVSRGFRSPIEMESRRGGLDLLDRAREFTGIPSLSPELVDDCVKSFSEGTVKAELDEAAARASGLFATGSTAAVIVPSRSLEKYVLEQPYLEEHGGTMVVRWQRTIRIADIVADWAYAGYPGEWDPSA